MADKTYLVALKLPENSIRQVSAASFAFHGDHLAFLDAKGALAALFLTEIVQSWNVIPVLNQPQ